MAFAQLGTKKASNGSGGFLANRKVDKEKKVVYTAFQALKAWPQHVIDSSPTNQVKSCGQLDIMT